MSNCDLFGQKTSFQLDDFIIKDQIGIGKFGAVYKAIEKQSQQIVAIKIINKRSISSQVLFTQLKRQIEVQSRLKHPSICQLYAYFHDANNVFIILQYCPQGSLAFVIKEKRQVLSDKKIASIFLQIVQGVAYMHTRHVMHRDLKLQNILLDQLKNVKISDFGWCVHHPSQRNTFCGTMEYISPEMLNKESYQHSIDMYCVGIILYQLFYFKSPFLGQDQAETIENIKEGKLYFDDSVRIIPEEAKILIKKLLDRNPLKRPKAKDLFNDQFIVNSKEKEQIKQKRRLTQETFRRFKDQIFKLSQQTMSKPPSNQDTQIKEQKQQIMAKPKDKFIIIEEEKITYLSQEKSQESKITNPKPAQEASPLQETQQASSNQQCSEENSTKSHIISKNEILENIIQSKELPYISEIQQNQIQSQLDKKSTKIQCNQSQANEQDG